MSGWHPASHFCLTKGRTEPGTVFCVFSHAGILDRVTWARQATDGTFAPMRFARAGGKSPPHSETAAAACRLRWPRSTSLGHGFWDGRDGHSLRVCQMWTTRAWLTIVPSHRRTFLSGKSQNIENFFSLESGTPSTDFFFL